MQVAPGATYEAVIDWGVTGLVGTLGLRVIDNAGATTVARSTSGITEYPAGSGIYQRTGNVAPSVAGQFTLVWDDGSITPGHVATDDLVVAYTPQSAGDPTLFAMADDLAVRLGLVLTDDEETRATALIALASGVVTDEVGFVIGLVEDDPYTRPGTTDPRIPLPGPVVSVASVEINDIEIAGWYVVGNELVRDGLVRSFNTFDYPTGLLSSGFGYERDTLTITYTHGYATVPSLVRQTVLEMCVRVWVNPGSVVQAGDGSEDTTFAPYADPPRGLMLTKSELRALRRKFGMRGRSLTIGGG